MASKYHSLGKFEIGLFGSIATNEIGCIVPDEVQVENLNVGMKLQQVDSFLVRKEYLEEELKDLSVKLKAFLVTA